MHSGQQVQRAALLTLNKHGNLDLILSIVNPDWVGGWARAAMRHLNRRRFCCCLQPGVLAASQLLLPPPLLEQQLELGSGHRSRRRRCGAAIMPPALDTCCMRS